MYIEWSKLVMLTSFRKMICFTNLKLIALEPKKYVSQESKIKCTLIVVMIKVIYYCIFGPMWVKYVFKY